MSNPPKSPRITRSDDLDPARAAEIFAEQARTAREAETYIDSTTARGKPVKLNGPIWVWVAVLVGVIIAVPIILSFAYSVRGNQASSYGEVAVFAVAAILFVRCLAAVRSGRMSALGMRFERAANPVGYWVSLAVFLGVAFIGAASAVAKLL